MTDFRFFETDEMICETSVKGIFVVGAAGGPKEISHSMVQGSCSASKVKVLLRSLEG